MSHPALLLKKHLANTYAWLDKIEKELADFMQRTTDEIDKLGREKLSVQEFREFIDIFNKTLAESLPSPGEEPVQSEAKQPRQELSSENSVDYQGEAAAILNQKSNGASHIVEAPKTPDTTQQLVATQRTSFPMKVVGEVFYVGNGITSVVGDAEIPSGTTVDETLVVKGNIKVGESCRLLKNVKALRDVMIGANSTVEGNIISGGKITVGSNCVVHGSIESDGDVEIDENVIVEGSLRSKSSIILNQLARVFQAIYAAKGVSVLKAR